jgi:hypothetical protein
MKSKKLIQIVQVAEKKIKISNFPLTLHAHDGCVKLPHHFPHAKKGREWPISAQYLHKHTLTCINTWFRKFLWLSKGQLHEHHEYIALK